MNSEPAQGAYIISFTEQGGSVVANGSGSFDISSLRGQGIGGAGTSYTVAGFGDLLLGPGPTIYTILLWGPITGPSSYGTSFQRLASSASGGPVGLSIDNVGISLELNYLYVSGSSLPVTATWNNQTIGGMGLTPGVYNYTWGSDSLTIDIAQSSAPEPASVALFGIGCATLFITQRFLRRTR